MPETDIEQMDDRPEVHEDYQQMRQDLESGECAVLDHKGNASFSGKHLGQFNEDAKGWLAIATAMEKAQYWPDVYYVNDHGNVDLVSLKYGVKRKKLHRVVGDGLNLMSRVEPYEVFEYVFCPKVKIIKSWV